MDVQELTHDQFDGRRAKPAEKGLVEGLERKRLQRPFSIMQESKKD